MRGHIVEQAMQQLTDDTVNNALAASFSGARIELVDFTRHAVPRGEVVFPASGLIRTQSAGTAALWKGYVRYGGPRRLAIWARVRISATLQRVRAVEELPPTYRAHGSRHEMELPLIMYNYQHPLPPSAFFRHNLDLTRFLFRA